RRSAPTEEDRRHRALAHARGRRGDFRRKSAHEPPLIDGGVANMAVEVAIRAFRQAERPVNINSEVARLLQGKPPRASRMRGRDVTAPGRAAAVRAFPRSSFRRMSAQSRPAKTPDHIRSLCCHAEETRACRRSALRTPRDVRPAK